MQAEPAVTAPWVVDLRLVDRDPVIDVLAPTRPGGPAGWQAAAKRAVEPAKDEVPSKNEGTPPKPGE